MRTQADDLDLDGLGYGIVTQFRHCTAVVLPRVVATTKRHSNKGYSLSALRTLRAMQLVQVKHTAQSGKQTSRCRGHSESIHTLKNITTLGPMNARKQEGGRRTQDKQLRQPAPHWAEYSVWWRNNRVCSMRQHAEQNQDQLQVCLKEQQEQITG